mmetsp:Transcript_26966/g.48011  ORF Transcript_26966/g.48011 Transcript_26966/m.48011 type:complete len:370 (-) Transcript_26966:21-1130(-)|eukprot:CAMPEP_0115057194 /NCGR_PEP_ID=MMETSP0227-20121206/5621_1 /TAXON_ID=89957 /ORGANISM="Polarella glacialis, Strain CCMP 1383" /LENGTH=369 /DNA_ID=CAMNT_0002441967 /DNA_START=202 /DNA_END=1311 /DNA_ORIENTATION=-
MLQVIDALLIRPPGVRVLVDWCRQGDEAHFQYGASDFDLWAQLFESDLDCGSARELASGAPDSGVQPPVALKTRLNPLFSNMCRGWFWTLPAEVLKGFRKCYHDQAAGRLRPRPAVLQQVASVCAAWAGGKAVGVHKRLGTPEVAQCQLTQRAPATAEYIAKAREQLAISGASTLFLATDDALALQAFREAFPEEGAVQLVVREGVKRSEGGVREDGVDNEVHRSPCEASDAADVLVDALCLARCSDLVCIDSNVAIFVALLSPSLQLHPLNGVLPFGWEAVASAAQEDRLAARSWEVVFRPQVFVRSGPSIAHPNLGLRTPGSIVQTTGRSYEGWVELEGNAGWMLTDGSALHPPVGQLMKPLYGQFQ